MKAAILPKDVYIEFLTNVNEIDPKECLIQICEMQGKFPIFFLISKLKYSKSDFINLIQGLKTTKKANKKKLITRINNYENEKMLVTDPEGKFDAITDQMKNNKKLKSKVLSGVDKYKTDKEIEEMCKALKTLNKEELESIKSQLFAKLLDVVKKYCLGEDVETLPSCIKNAINYIDEKMFRAGV